MIVLPYENLSTYDMTHDIVDHRSKELRRNFEWYTSWSSYVVEKIRVFRDLDLFTNVDLDDNS